MMKLYYGTGSCSLAPHIVLREGGYDFELEQVNLQTKAMAGGGDFSKISPNGYVPVLQLADGAVLTEGVAMNQYLADHAPNKAKLAPANGTMARYRLQEWLNFITSELHKGIGGFFSPLLTGEYAEGRKKVIHQRLSYVENHLATTKQDYLMAEGFSIADAYLFTVLRWTVPTKISLDAYPQLIAYMARIGDRPSVQEAMAAEGIA